MHIIVVDKNLVEIVFWELLLLRQWSGFECSMHVCNIAKLCQASMWALAGRQPSHRGGHSKSSQLQEQGNKCSHQSSQPSLPSVEGEDSQRAWADNAKVGISSA